MTERKTFTMTCPGCSEQVELDPARGWFSRGVGGLVCQGKTWHGSVISEKLGRAFHEAGAQALADAGLDKVVHLPDWEDTNEIQRLMVYTGITAVLMETVT